MKYYGIKRKKRKEEIEFIYAKANAAFCGAQRPLMRLTSAAMRNITAA